MEDQKDIVTIEHAAYQATADLRTTFSDVIGGTAALRAKYKKYLPQFPLEHDDDYKARWGAATMLNVTRKTRETLCGLVFQKPLTLSEDVPKEIVDLCENIDNQGNNLDTFARRVFEDSFDGWAVIVTDTPKTKASDLAEEKRLGLRPYCRSYRAADVINWDYSVDPISQKQVLTLIVFREVVSKANGAMFKREYVSQYRVYHIKDNKVFWQLWEEQKNSKGETEIVQVTKDTAIEKLDVIPVAVIGELGDPPPLMDLAYKNLEHAQTYSDYKAIIHKTCVPIPYTTGLDKADAGEAISGAMMWHLPESGSMGFAEVTGGSIEATRTSLEDNKVDMSWLGLQMLMPKPQGGNATATEVVSDTIQDTSELQTRANQLKDALELTFGFIAQYMGKGKDMGGSIELGCSWQQMVLTPQEIQVLSSTVADGNLSLESFLWHLERSGKLPPDITAEDELKRITDEMAQVRPLINAAAMPSEPKDENQNEQETPDEETAKGSNGTGNLPKR